MPTRPTDHPLSPCVLVIKTPVASRKRVADRLVRTGRRLAGQVEDAAREQAGDQAVEKQMEDRAQAHDGHLTASRR